MVPVARRNLFQDKTRLLISVGGVALAIFLIILLNGLLAGMYRQITTYVDNTPADLYIAQKGVTNLQSSSSILPLSLAARVEKVEGVKSVSPILAQYAILDLHNKKVTTFMVGFDAKRGGGPWQIASGRSVERDDEVVVDLVLASRHNLVPGDKLRLMGKDFTIVGLSRDTSSWMVSMIFVTHSAASQLLLAPNTTSFILVSSAGPAAADLERRIEEQIDGVNVLRGSELGANDIKLFGGIFDAPLKLMVTIAFLVGSLIVGLTIYTAMVEKVREYGILKALGMRNWRLYLVVFEQALTASALGFVSGYLMALGGGWAIQQVWPQFLFITKATDVVQVAGIALLMAVIAAYLPARYVANIDPASVFKK